MNARARIRRLEQAQARRRPDPGRPFYIEGGRLCGGSAALNMADLMKSIAAYEAADKIDARAEAEKAGRP